MSMIRLLLNSRDLKLQSALSGLSAMDFNVAVDSSRARVKELVLNQKCDVVILDVDCHPGGEQFEFLQELQTLKMPVVVLTNDEPEVTMELIGRGVQNYCAKPVSLPELKLIIRKAHEYAILK